jgi:hypothetical protein
MRRFAYTLIIAGVLLLSIGTYFILHQPLPDPLGTVPLILSVEPAPIPMPLQNRGQVEQFMLSDPTDQHPYTEDYKCGSFAQDVVDNASAMGIEAYYIIVKWEDSYIVHAIVLFPTIEDGDVYVDATQADWWVNFELGEGNYYSYLMTDPSQRTFTDKTLEAYGVNDGKGTVRWTAYEAIPTPSPTPSPSPTLIPTLAPTPIPLPPSSSLRTPILLNREEVRIFMLNDQTDKNAYTDTYVCNNFARDVADNATALGIDVSGIAVSWDGWEGYHAILCFPTIEDGDVYVDCTLGDWWVELEYGEGNYKSYSMTDPNKYWFYGETLLYYTIYF